MRERSLGPVAQRQVEATYGATDDSEGCGYRGTCARAVKDLYWVQQRSKRLTRRIRQNNSSRSTVEETAPRDKEALVGIGPGV
jgi:hypothetical protein